MAKVSQRRRLKSLAQREYLPLAATISMWAVIVVAIGHADAARLLATTIAIRAIQFLTKLATTVAVRRRTEAPKWVRRQAKRFALNLQLAALVVALVLVALLAEAMKANGQEQIAAFLPFVALGMPARYIRFADINMVWTYYRMALTMSGLAVASIGLAAGWPVTLLALAFGAREWVAYAVLRLWPGPEKPSKIKLAEPLIFEEVAQYSAILGRRLLTYRLTKALLAVFGPFGNVAARTGRGLNWHRKVEPYVPHHLGGFIAFCLVAFGAAAYLALKSGEPAAMIAAAGLMQVGAVAANVLLLWRYLPPKGSEPLPEDDEDD